MSKARSGAQVGKGKKKASGVLLAQSGLSGWAFVARRLPRHWLAAAVLDVEQSGETVVDKFVVTQTYRGVGSLPLSVIPSWSDPTPRVDMVRVRRWGANAHQIGKPPGGQHRHHQLAARAPEFDFQNLHRNKRSLAINLKTKEGLEIFPLEIGFARPMSSSRISARRAETHRLGVRLQSGEADQPAHRLWQHLGLHDPDQPPAASGFVDQIAQGADDLMSIFRVPRARAGAGQPASDRRPLRRPPARASSSRWR